MKATPSGELLVSTTPITGIPNLAASFELKSTNANLFDCPSASTITFNFFILIFFD
jgi:hypothetical protein